MSEKHPYIYWSREELYDRMIQQAIDFKIEEAMLELACFDNEWTPQADFNGCNMVQDELHPFLPCFIHDYRWFVEGGSVEADKEFRTNLLKAGFSKWKANSYFIAVRLAWTLYFKWKK